MTGTEITTVAKTAVAKTRKTAVAKAAAPKTGTKIPDFPVATRVVNESKAAAAKAMAQNKEIEGQAAKASALGYSQTGLFAMACYDAGVGTDGKPLCTGDVPLKAAHYGSKMHGAPQTPQTLARLVLRDRNVHEHSWGKIAAAYRITEGCARTAFEAASGVDQKTSNVGAWKSRRG